MEKIVNKFIECECHEHFIRISKWDDEDIYLIQFYAYSGYRLNIWQRIKGAWSMLRNGEALAHELIVDRKSAQEVINTLSK